MSQSIGKVAFDADGPRTATLHADRSWSIEPPFDDARQTVVLGMLDAISARHTGPADGYFGPAEVARAATLLGGRVTVQPQTPTDDAGTVY